MNAVSTDDILGRILTATIATQLLKSNDIEQNIGRAQSARAKLEVLETSLTLGQIDSRQAVAEFLKCVDDASFLDA
jgi:ribosomal protein L17